MASETHRCTILSAVLREIQVKERQHSQSLVELLQELEATTTKATGKEGEENTTFNPNRDIEKIETTTAEIISEIDAILAEIQTKRPEEYSKSTEYALEVTEFLLEWRPVILESLFSIEDKPTPRVVTHVSNEKITTKTVVQQAFFTAKSVTLAQRQLADIRNALSASDDPSSLLPVAESAFRDLPPRLHIPALFISKSSATPTDLFTRTAYELACVPIAIYCARQEYGPAYSCRYKASSILAQQRETDSVWTINVSPALISPIGYELLAKSQSLQTTGSYEAALDYWYVLDPLGYQSLELLMGLGKVRDSEGNGTEALMAFRKVEAIVNARKLCREDVLQVFLRLAHLLKTFCFTLPVVLKVLTNALEMCRKLPSNNETLANVQFFLGKVYMELYAFEKSEAAFQFCLDLIEVDSTQLSKLADVYYNFGQLQLKLKDFVRCEDFLHRSLAADTRFAGELNISLVYESLVSLYAAWNKPKHSEQTHKRAYRHLFERGEFNKCSDWGRKLISFHRDRCQRQSEETAACSVMRISTTGNAVYYRWDTIRAFRGLYGGAFSH